MVLCICFALLSDWEGPRHQFFHPVSQKGSRPQLIAKQAEKYWCDKPRPALREYVRHMFPSANSLHLSDVRLVLQRRLSKDEEEVG
eukprot:1040059-Pelagomonas_calceolata.AAC.1